MSSEILVMTKDHAQKHTEENHDKIDHDVTITL